MKTIKQGVNKEYARANPKAWGKGSVDDKKRDVYSFYNETGIIDYEPAIRELSRLSHLPRFICRMVYDAETKLLNKAGILAIKNK